ncbi:MAG: DUF4325 domain-containing protein [Candidatus Omnitrophica bacterium]|nr:DUF4325 domain-containing protein [Candidatus Omnitrophota bacterium]
MDIRKLILDKIEQQGEVKASEIVGQSGFSRAYVNRFFRKLREEGRIILLGKANAARYVPAKAEKVKHAKESILSFSRVLENKGLSEDSVLDEIKKETGIFLHLPGNVSHIIDYAFTEMLNNAIEHSRSDKVACKMKKEAGIISFEVDDSGVGIFNNIKQKKGLSSRIEAIQDLMKGKLTTMPESHSGEGIFFTSKSGDILTIKSSGKKLIFNNLLDDVFLEDSKEEKGTKVIFSIESGSKKILSDIFREYTDDSFEFQKTKVRVHLYRMGNEYISRSQARRVLAGLEKFRFVILDFKGVKTVGQAFADEIFRVWKERYPEIKVKAENYNENIEFMIKRAKEA